MCIGPDYNYGHESWRLFTEKLKELKPEVEIVGETFPKLMAKDYSAPIEQIRKVKPDAVWCPLWGQDAVDFIKQAKEAKLFEKIKFAFPVGAALETLVPLGKETPAGLYMASRYFFTTPDSAENRDFVKKYRGSSKNTRITWPKRPTQGVLYQGFRGTCRDNGPRGNSESSRKRAPRLADSGGMEDHAS